MKRFSVPSLTLSTAFLVSAFLACTTTQRAIGELVDDPPLLTTTTDGGVTESALYCPSDRCPEGYTTCSGSRFKCEVDLKTDPNNCGACGVQCPKTIVPPNGVFTDPYEGARSWSCSDGRCVLACAPSIALDCDGLVDNGCEALPSENDNCGACGNVCDSSKPCAWQVNGTFACGCPAGTADCGLGMCMPIEGSDLNCGACSNVCNPNGDGGAPPSNAYYGCVGTECGHLKCSGGWGNCDGRADNGCEKPLTTNQDCGSCDSPCAAGLNCLYDKDSRSYQCLCPPGLTYCDQRCVDLTSDDNNCGTCGQVCGVPGSKIYVGFCSYGECAFACSTGWEDCNGNSVDGCEINTMSDPQNCGGCGITCDGIAGQACAGGRCVMEHCNQDGGVIAR